MPTLAAVSLAANVAPICRMLTPTLAAVSLATNVAPFPHEKQCFALQLSMPAAPYRGFQNAIRGNLFL